MVALLGRFVARAVDSPDRSVTVPYIAVLPAHRIKDSVNGLMMMQGRVDERYECISLEEN